VPCTTAHHPPDGACSFRFAAPRSDPQAARPTRPRTRRPLPLAIPPEAGVQFGAKASEEHCPHGTSTHPTGGDPSPRRIEVTVSPKGEVTVQTRGYIGESCTKASQFLESLGVVTTDRKTVEFYETVPIQQQQETQA